MNINNCITFVAHYFHIWTLHLFGNLIRKQAAELIEMIICLKWVESLQNWPLDMICFRRCLAGIATVVFTRVWHIESIRLSLSASNILHSLQTKYDYCSTRIVCSVRSIWIYRILPDLAFPLEKPKKAKG